jgi:DHA2 family multidrug resistance protein
VSNGTAQAQGPALPPLMGPRLWIAAFLTALANFFAVLDLTVANVSIPNIASGLAVSPHEGTWILTSYAISEAIAVPMTGWLAGRFGPARMFVFAVASFGVISTLCGLATSFEMLLFFRIIQGLCGGPMIPLCQTILLSIFPREKAGTAMAMWSMTAVMGPVLAPTIGGLVCETWGWRWIFLMNLPFTLMSAFVCGTLLIKRDPPTQSRRLDLVGVSLMVIWIGALQITLDKGQELDWFESPLIISLTVVAVVGFIAFLIWELTDSNPIVNLRLFQNRSFLMGTVVGCVSFGAYFGSVVLTPLWLQTNMGYTPFLAGLVNAPPGLTMFFLSGIPEWVASRIDRRFMISTALILFSGSFLWRGHFNSDVSMNILLISQVMNGACIAFSFTPAVVITLAGVRPQEVASAAGLMAFCRTTTLAFTTALTTSYWQNATTRNREIIIDRYGETQGIDQFMASGFSFKNALSYLEGMVQNQAVMLATNDIYFIYAGGMVVAAVCVWFAPRPPAKATLAAH